MSMPRTIVNRFAGLDPALGHQHEHLPFARGEPVQQFVRGVPGPPAVSSAASPGLDEHRHAVQDAVQAEDELVVRAVVGLEHPGRYESGEGGEP